MVVEADATADVTSRAVEDFCSCYERTMTAELSVYQSALTERSVVVWFLNSNNHAYNADSPFTGIGQELAEATAAFLH